MTSSYQVQYVAFDIDLHNVIRKKKYKCGYTKQTNKEFGLSIWKIDMLKLVGFTV